MREEYLRYLVCPETGHPLTLEKVESRDGASVETGSLKCTGCDKTFPIANHIPRFVPLNNYSSSFGFEWTRHAKTQYDSYTGSHISEQRLFDETKWERNLAGQIILEVGSGSGRFTEHLVATGAVVISMDYSYAVEANYASNGNSANLLIVQGDLYHMPFRESFADKLLCIGVLQHTPDVEKAFLSLIPFLRPKGDLVVDVYHRKPFLKQLFNTRYWVRNFTKRMASQSLYRGIERYINFMWPILGLLNKVPFSKTLTSRFLVADYRGRYDLPDDILKQWAVLDTFDMLSPYYDTPQTIETVQRWFSHAGMQNVEVHQGYNGIEARAIKL